MRSLVLSAALALLLAGCDPNDPRISPQNIDAAVTSVQQRVVQVCGFLPAERTISAILQTFMSSSIPYLSVVDSIATGICSKVGVPSSGRRLSAPSYRGVRIQGNFVR